MVDRQLIKRILGQRNLAQSLIARHQLGVSGEMPGHPAFVAPLAVVAAPDARPAPLFEQTPLDDAALASFFAAPDAQRAPLPEMRLQPAPVAPAVTDEGAEIGALPAAAPNPPNRLDQQDVRPPHQPQSQMGRQVAEQAAAPPDTRAEPRPHASSERHDTGAAAQAHQPAFVTAEMLQPAEMPQSAALPQVRPPAQAAPETVIAQQAGTAIPTKIAELLARESPPAPQDRPQP
ncbi:MAG TPA: hypothetical protein VFT99_10565, partial [Roseiflexaceae bacterium]|nr:hypothetical protein [Roseiflexaceae bacterium]